MSNNIALLTRNKECIYQMIKDREKYDVDRYLNYLKKEKACIERLIKREKDPLRYYNSIKNITESSVNTIPKFFQYPYNLKKYDLDLDLDTIILKGDLLKGLFIIKPLKDLIVIINIINCSGIKLLDNFCIEQFVLIEHKARIYQKNTRI